MPAAIRFSCFPMYTFDSLQHAQHRYVNQLRESGAAFQHLQSLRDIFTLHLTPAAGQAHAGSSAGSRERGAALHVPFDRAAVHQLPLRSAASMRPRLQQPRNCTGACPSSTFAISLPAFQACGHAGQQHGEGAFIKAIGIFYLLCHRDVEVSPCFAAPSSEPSRGQH